MSDVIPYAGLILPDASDLELEAYFASANLVLSAHPAHINASIKFSEEASAVFGRKYGVQITADEMSIYGPQVRVEVFDLTTDSLDIEDASVVLSGIVEEMLSHSHADIIVWQNEDVLLETSDFLRLREMAPRPALDVVETVEEDLLQAWTETNMVSEDPAVENEHRVDPKETVSSWLMTATVGFFALPFAGFLAVVGLFRGLRLRLASHALGLTGLYVALQNSSFLNGLL